MSNEPQEPAENEAPKTARESVFEILPDGYTGLDYVVVCEALNEDGDLVLVTRWSDGVSAWKAVGMATSLCDDLRHSLSGAGMTERDE